MTTQTNDNIGYICGRCSTETDQLYSSPCYENPEMWANSGLGQYHCPDCGTMIMAGIKHFKVCIDCLSEIKINMLTADRHCLISILVKVRETLENEVINGVSADTIETLKLVNEYFITDAYLENNRPREDT